MTFPAFCDAVRTYCTMTGASVTSWGRTPKHNQAVGGVAFSAHQVWLGLDVVYDAPVEEGVRKVWAGRLGLRLVIEGDHDHVQPSEWAAG